MLKSVLPHARKGVDRLTGAFAVLGAACACVLTIAVSLDVGSRQVLGGSLPGMIELSESLFVAMVFLGLAQAERTGEHVRVTLLTGRLAPRAAAGLRSVTLVIALAVVGWMTWATGLRAVDSVARMEYRLGLLSWPIWPVRVVIPICLTLFGLQLALSLADNLARFNLGGRPRHGDRHSSI